jgi:hypothetical protein
MMSNEIRRSWPWLVTGVAFVAYPLLRPYTDETTMAGLAAMSSGRWLVAHLLGMLAFAVLPVGLGRLRPSLGALGYVGAVLLLPYYGGEAFALHAIGRHGVATSDLSMLTVVDGFRYNPVAITMFGLGLLVLAAAGVLAVVACWPRGLAWRVAVGAVGLGLLLYLPQFFAFPAVRIGHGLLLGLGCVAVALLSAGWRTEPTGYRFSVGRESVVESAATNAS